MRRVLLVLGGLLAIAAIYVFLVMAGVFGRHRGAGEPTRATLPRAVVLYRHALRAGLVPIVSMMGMQFAYLMGGAIVVENVFAWNGIGRLAIEAVFARDYPVIQGFILVFATVVVLVSVIIDVLYAWLDPRIRYA